MARKTFNFKKKRALWKKFKRTAPIVVGNNARNHFLKSFRDSGFTDLRFTAWQKRKARKDNRPGRAILVDSANMKDSIRVRTATFRIIRIGSYGIKYARFHNRGEGSLPKREFIGNSRRLESKNKKFINLELKKILRA